MANSPTKEEIKEARESLGLSQGAAANLAGLGSAARWAEYENGKRNMPDTRWEFFKKETGLGDSSMVGVARKAYLSNGALWFRPVAWRGTGRAMSFSEGGTAREEPSPADGVTSCFPDFADLIGGWETVPPELVSAERK
jgi:hypothetical protein